MTTHLYLRVSTTEQAADNKSSLVDQEQRCRGAAMIRGVPSPVVHTDAGVSGATPLSKRPAGAAMCQALRPGDVVIAAKMDRAFRSAADALTTAADFKRRGIALILVDMGVDPVTENGASQLFFAMLAAFAEFERTRFAERSSDGRKAKARRQGHIGGSAPYGYRAVGKGASAVLEPVPDEQHVLELVRSNHANGASVREIADGLTRNNIFSRVGKPFFHQQIHRMLRAAPKSSEASAQEDGQPLRAGLI